MGSVQGEPTCINIYISVIFLYCLGGGPRGGDNAERSYMLLPPHSASFIKLDWRFQFNVAWLVPFNQKRAELIAQMSIAVLHIYFISIRKKSTSLFF